MRDLSLRLQPMEGNQSVAAVALITVAPRKIINPKPGLSP